MKRIISLFSEAVFNKSKAGTQNKTFLEKTDYRPEVEEIQAALFSTSLDADGVDDGPTSPPQSSISPGDHRPSIPSQPNSPDPQISINVVSEVSYTATTSSRVSTVVTNSATPNFPLSEPGPEPIPSPSPSQKTSRPNQRKTNDTSSAVKTSDGVDDADDATTQKKGTRRGKGVTTQAPTRVLRERR